MSVSSEFRHAFNFYRSNGFTAARAMEGAKKDAEKGIERYTSSPWRKPCGNGIATNGARWIESPASMGLRFAGYCDEIYHHIEHTGWYTDNHQCDTIRGVVYQLPGRDGKARFVAGHDNADNGKADNGGPAYVDFSTIYESDFKAEMRLALRGIGKQYQTPAMHNPGYWAEAAHETAKKEAARAADEFARIQAEEEREYRTAWEAGVQWAEAAEEVAESRKEFYRLNSERRMAMQAVKDRASLPAICRTIRTALEGLLDDITQARDKMKELAAGDYEGLIFYPNESLRAAFNDGAGETVI